MFKAPFYSNGRIGRIEYILSIFIFLGGDLIFHFAFGTPSNNAAYGRHNSPLGIYADARS